MAGVGGEGAGEADALTLAAGELPGIAARNSAKLVAESRPAERGLRRAGWDWPAGADFAVQGKAGVALDGHVGKEAGLLNDVADGAAEVLWVILLGMDCR